MSLGLDKADGWRILRGERVHLASYLACIDECISERECRKFEEGLDKVKLAMYKKFGKRVEFRKYLHCVSDAGTRLSLGLEGMV